MTTIHRKVTFLQRSVKVKSGACTSEQLRAFDLTQPKQVPKVSSKDLTIVCFGRMIKEMISFAKYESQNDPELLRELILKELRPKLAKEAGKFDSEKVLTAFKKNYNLERASRFLTNCFVYFANKLKVQVNNFSVYSCHKCCY